MLNAQMRIGIDLNESEIDLNECEHFSQTANWDRSKRVWTLFSKQTEIDLNECEHFLKLRTEIDLNECEHFSQSEAGSIWTSVNTFLKAKLDRSEIDASLIDVIDRSVQVWPHKVSFRVTLKYNYEIESETLQNPHEAALRIIYFYDAFDLGKMFIL